VILALGLVSACQRPSRVVGDEASARALANPGVTDAGPPVLAQPVLVDAEAPLAVVDAGPEDAGSPDDDPMNLHKTTRQELRELFQGAFGERSEEHPSGPVLLSGAGAR